MNATTDNRAQVTRVGGRELRIERVFNASLDQVWRAYTDPALLAQWWGRGNQLVVEKFELERGGHWRFVEHTEEHGAHGFEGRFREITPQELISQTFEWDGMPGHVAVETARFEDLGDGRTKLTATTMFMTDEDCEGMVRSGMEQGMNESYAALDRLLAMLS